MIVRENIEFKRGIDPEDSLNIGHDRKIYDPTIEDFKKLKIGKKYLLYANCGLDNYYAIIMPHKSNPFEILISGTFQTSIEKLLKNPISVIWTEESFDTFETNFGFSWIYIKNLIY